MSFRVCFLRASCTSEEIVHAQERQTFIELTRVSFEGLFFPFFFLSFPLHCVVDKTDFNIAEGVAVTKISLFSGCIKALTATTLAMLPC